MAIINYVVCHGQRPRRRKQKGVAVNDICSAVSALYSDPVWPMLVDGLCSLCFAKQPSLCNQSSIGCT